MEIGFDHKTEIGARAKRSLSQTQSRDWGKTTAAHFEGFDVGRDSTLRAKHRLASRYTRQTLVYSAYLAPLG
jgi:hypothetical protein